ncbi:hypothetical protein PybrP1_013222 [[Pythium] brassicae (nom. inval.)]|nr:hypothetical protein PybrP1_013222 [[Pythium] brassicae (nom. inval.)]
MYRLPIAAALRGLALPLGATAALTASSSSALTEGKRGYSGGGARGTPRMLVGDPDAFAKKWKKFSTDGVDKLLVISDFDQTLTRYLKPDGDQESSSHGLLMTSSVLSPQVCKLEREIFARFFPIEVSPTLSEAEKLPYMVEWWNRAHELLLEYKLTKSQILQAVEQNDVGFRSGFHEIFRLLANENVPVLIFSAGLYDVIHAVLEKEFARSPEKTTPKNVHVVSNMMQFDASGTISGFEGQLIHSINKNASVLLDTPFWKQCQIEKRHNIILLGDSRGDVRMARGLEYKDDEIIRIGFLNTHVDESLEEYLRLYDVVLTHDASLLPVEMLLHQLQKNGKAGDNQQPLRDALRGNASELQVASLELEHVSGFTGKGKNTLHAHPRDVMSFVTCMGAAVVVGNVLETHNQQLLRGHDEEISVLAMANNGALLASAQACSKRNQERGAAVVVWDLAEQRDVFHLTGFQRMVLQMAFSPDDHFLAASSDDCRVVVWDMRTSEVVLSKAFPAPVTILNWGHVEEKCRRPKYELMFAYSSQLLRGELAYDIACMQYKLDVSAFGMPNVGLTRSYLCATMTHSRSDLLAGTTAGELVVFSVGAQVYRNAVPVSRNGVHSIACCRASGYVYVGAGDGVLKKLVGRDADWNLVGQVQLVGGISSLSVGPDGACVFAGTSAGKMYVVASATLAPTELASSHLGSITGCAFGDSSEEVATISVDGSVRVWNLSTYQLKCMATEAAAGLSVAITKGSTTAPTVLSGWADGWLRAYDAATAHCKWHIANAHRGHVTSVASSATYVVSGASDGAVSVWSALTRELVLQFHEHKRGVSQVLVDVGKPHWVHSCGLDKALFAYDLKSARRVVAQQARDGAFHSITQRLDSETEIVTAGSDGRLLFWDCDVAEPIAQLLDPSRLRVAFASVSPSGRFLATCGEDCDVKVFALASMALAAAGQGHSDTVNCLAWSPDERQLVAVGSDSCVSVWNFYVDES